MFSGKVFLKPKNEKTFWILQVFFCLYHFQFSLVKSDKFSFGFDTLFNFINHNFFFSLISFTASSSKRRELNIFFFSTQKQHFGNITFTKQF